MPPARIHAAQMLAPLPAIPLSASLAWARVILTYLCRHHRLPNLSAAPRFTDMVQRRKLYDHDPRHTALMDKLAAKQRAADMLGKAWVTPTLWQGETPSIWASHGQTHRTFS